MPFAPLNRITSSSRPGTRQLAGAACWLKFPYIVVTLEPRVVALRFEWDDRKNAQNRRKHGVSFEQARTVFFDEHALLMADPDHSEHEERFVLLGLSSAPRTLVVCHCYRRQGDVVRLISARADRQEREQYEVRWIR